MPGHEDSLTRPRSGFGEGVIAGGWRCIPPSGTAGVSGEGPRHRGVVRSPGQGWQAAGRTRQQEPEGRKSDRISAPRARGVSGERGGGSGPRPGQQVAISIFQFRPRVRGAEPSGLCEAAGGRFRPPLPRYHPAGTAFRSFSLACHSQGATGGQPTS
jgi:hypothetical protein